MSGRRTLGSTTFETDYTYCSDYKEEECAQHCYFSTERIGYGPFENSKIFYESLRNTDFCPKKEVTT